VVKLPATGDAEILTIKQVAAYLKVADRTIYRLAATNGIPAFKVGGTWRFRQSDIDRWIAAQTKNVRGAER
jgi:excisionase family DNA binding protein